jgi:hypothetical protein
MLNLTVHLKSWRSCHPQRLGLNYLHDGEHIMHLMYP